MKSKLLLILIGLFLGAGGSMLSAGPAQAGFPSGFNVGVVCEDAELQIGGTTDCSILIDNQSGQTLTDLRAIALIDWQCVPNCPTSGNDAFEITAAIPAWTSQTSSTEVAWDPLGTGTLLDGEMAKLTVTIEAQRETQFIEVFQLCGAAMEGQPPGAGAANCDSVSVPSDYDHDGCTNTQEQQTAMGSELTGGQRDPKNFWDFYDAPDAGGARDRSVAGTDFFRVLARFGASGDPAGDPLDYPPPAAPAYHTAFDRGASAGPNPWNLTAADGSIAATDFFAILAQFGHRCA